jgi:plasmid stabilization system protein ParE
VACEVIVGRVALRDLARIREFISKDDPAAALSFCRKLLDHAEGLRTLPERGGHLRERPGARFLVVGSYLIVYRIDQEAKRVRILRFWHGARERRRI